MANFLKEKNLYTFYVGETQRKCVFDVNTGVLYGTKGSPLKSTPSGMGMFMCENYQEHNFSQVLYSFHENIGIPYTNMNDGRVLPILKLVERLEAIGCIINSYEADWLCFLELDSVQQLDKNFKTLTDFLKEEHVDGCRFRAFFKHLRREEIRQTVGNQYGEHLTPAILDYLQSHSDTFDNDEKIRAGAYYLVKGLYTFIQDNNATSNTFYRYFYYCNALEWEYKQKGGFVENYAKAKENYEANKDALITKQLAKNQSRFEEKLLFEDDNFVVIVPKTAEEFKAEAEYQHNCVYSMYMSRCADGVTNVVFIRRKDRKETSYITCEVSNYGVIRQFLTRFNHSVFEESAKAFEKAYQEHLMASWQ